MKDCSPAPAPLPARQAGFVSVPVDFLLLGGLSILHLAVFSWPALRQVVTSVLGHLLGPPIALLAGPFYDHPVNVYDAALLAALLTWVVNYPHFAATSHRLYRNRESIMQFPVTALGVPVVLLLALTAALMNPLTIAPWFAKIFLIWSPYHFSAQTLGVTLLYARRSGFAISPGLRRCLTWFIFSTYLGPILAAEAYPNIPYYGMLLPTFGLPPGLFPIYKLFMLATGALSVVLLLRNAWRNHRRIPLLIVVPPLAQYAWFVGGAGVAGFQEFVPAYHSLQYLLIAWVINLKDRVDEGQIQRTLPAVRLETLRWFALNVAGGAFLFYLLPSMAGKTFSIDPYAATGITIAAVQIHHFFVDGVIWKLRNPKVGQPLMTSWPELTGRMVPA